MKWEYFGDKKTRKQVLNFFTKNEETLLAGNRVKFFWGNSNGEWHFLSLSKQKQLIGTIMKVSDSGGYKTDKIVSKFDSYYVTADERIHCGTLKKPDFRNFRKAMHNNGRGSYGKVWILYPNGELTKLGDAIKLWKGSIKELPEGIKPSLYEVTDKITLRRNGFYMPTLKGELKIATKNNDLYIWKNQDFKKIELTKDNIKKVNNEQIEGLFLIYERNEKNGKGYYDFEYVCRHRKEKAAKCLECGETIEGGEKYYCFDCTHYFTPVFSHTYHWKSRKNAKCNICGSLVEIEEIRGL